MEGPWQPSECNDMFKASEVSVEIGPISRLGQTSVSLSLCALSLSRCPSVFHSNTTRTSMHSMSVIGGR